MCKYSDDTGYECPHDKLDDSDYCIFHLQDVDKDADEFNKGIKEILETEDDSINLNGFYFPPESSDFSAQIFQKKIDFCHVIFSGKANFKDATFSRESDFSGAEFLGCAYFRNTTFSEETGFCWVAFSEKAYFRGATFSDAYFDDAVFLGGALFWSATFSGDASFGGVTFSRYAYFEEATFLGDVFFWNALFSEDVFFEYDIFSDDVTFKDAIFSGDASFGGATFSEKTDFEGATFSGATDFQGAELTGKFKFIPGKSGDLTFESAYFSDNIIIKADMSRCFFANSNVERVDMTDSTWIVENKPKDSYKIWEQRQGELSSNWKELEGIYRRLKQSYQRFGDNDTAGNFYYHEMECKRQQLKGAKKLFWDVFYKLLCGYGEKPFNVIWASISIIFAASLFFFYWGIELLGSEVLNLTPRLINYDLSLNFQWVITNFGKVFNDWLECLYTSVITFTTLGYGDVHPIGFSRIVASVEAGIGIIMTALFIFVFTRKMLR